MHQSQFSRLYEKLYYLHTQTLHLRFDFNALPLLIHLPLTLNPSPVPANFVPLGMEISI